MTAHAQLLPAQVDPLIGEAKQRMRRRRLLVTAVLAGVAALAISFALLPAGRQSFVSTTGRWVPAGVEEVDVHYPGSPPSFRVPSPQIALRVTDPSEVKLIVTWFNTLTRDRHLWVAGCPVGQGESVSFTFRGAGGDELATAQSPPAPTGLCDPVRFSNGARTAALLFDREGLDGKKTLIGRVQQLLGVNFWVRGIDG